MHIPDGLMEPVVLALGWVIAIVVISISTWTVNRRIDKKQVPLMGTLAAGIFVAQMLNFPIGGGTTGHLIGAAMATILLGPFAGIIVITVILVIQCLLFGDGGITALGLNALNMAVIGCLVGWYVYMPFPDRFRTAGIFCASWLAVFLGALACSFELAASYSLSGGAFGIPGTIAFPTMLGYHAVIGIGEALITTSLVTFLAHVSPDMLRMPKIMLRGVKEEVAVNA
jgi:cobalt/nickel transport system permease protein